jgi:beta-lactamase regulating signal transducer with metallopeptidase domain
MDELLFPLAAVGLTFLVLIPALTLVSRAVLALKRRRLRTWPSFGTEATYAWLVMPTVLPVMWLTSSALHQSEPSRSVESCLIDHVQATGCLDAVMLLSLMVSGVTFSFVVRAWRERPRLNLDIVSSNHPEALRVASIVSGEKRLRTLLVQVAKAAPAPVFTVGWLRPRTIVDASFVRDADDAMLRAALLHELAHAAAYDTLRNFVLRLCLSVNPLGRLLTPDIERWQQAREAQCDSEAVHLGGEPLALAEGIVRAARFRCDGDASLAMLCGHGVAALKLRIALLLDGPPDPVRTLGHIVLGAAVLTAVVIPHLHSAGVLEHFHFEVERLLHPIR